MPTLRRLLLSIATVGAVALAAATLYASFTAQRLEPLLTDFWFKLRGQIAAPSSVILVGIDARSYEVLGQDNRRVLPRRFIAELLNKLAAAEAAGVVIDIGFEIPDADREVDLSLAAAVSGIRVVLPKSALIKKNSKRPITMPLLQSAAHELGSVDVTKIGGVIRTFPNVELPTLALAAARLVNPEATYPAGDFINFYGAKGAISYLSLVDALTDPQLKQKLAGKVAILGLQLDLESPGNNVDEQLTPFENMFGAEVQATMAANLITGDYIRRLSFASECWFIFGAVFFSGLFILLLRLELSVFFGAISILGLFISSYVGWVNYGYLPGTLTSTFFILALLTVNLLQSSDRFKQIVARTMSKQVAKHFLLNPEAVELGGKRTDVTIMFVDIAGFSALAENSQDEALFATLNRYHSSLYPIISHEKGNVLRFIADAMLTIWGAPEPISDGPQRALRAALKLQQEIAAFAKRENIPELAARIGIHFGGCAVGCFGSSEHFEYTAIGDNANICARLEQLNKVLGTPILMSSEVFSRLEDNSGLVCLGSFSLPGRDAATKVYSYFHEHLSQHERLGWTDALGAFAAQDWQAAIARFRSLALSNVALKIAAEFYLEQVAIFSLLGVPANWQGEVALEKDQSKLVRVLLALEQQNS